MTAHPSAAPRLRWVDTTRGLCMLAIVLNHTDYYLAGHAVVAFDLFGTNALMTFFIVSGYLFFRGTAFDIRHKLVSECRHLVVPYFLFTLLIAVPKALAHDEPLTGSLLVDIICGRASWFVAARVVAGILFATLIALSLRTTRWLLLGGCVALAAVPFIVHGAWIHVWNIDIALMSLVYLAIGYAYHAHEDAINSRWKGVYAVPLLAVVIALKVVEQRCGILVPVSPSRITSFPIFFVDTVLAAIVIITLCQHCDRWRPLNYIGRYSIVFYFLCGGVPLLVSRLLRAIGVTYHGNYLVILAAFALVVALMAALTHIIVRYFPWMIGRRRKEINRLAGQ